MTLSVVTIKPKTFPPAVDYHELIDALEVKHGYNVRDFSNHAGHFWTWHASKGYPDVDPQGKEVSESQIWFAEYRADPEGQAKRPEYQDFWHWFIDQSDEIYNGCIMSFYIGDYLDGEYGEIPTFVTTILTDMHEMIQGHPGYDEDERSINFFIEW